MKEETFYTEQHVLRKCLLRTPAATIDHTVNTKASTIPQSSVLETSLNQDKIKVSPKTGRIRSEKNLLGTVTFLSVIRHFPFQCGIEMNQTELKGKITFQKQLVCLYPLKEIGQHASSYSRSLLQTMQKENACIFSWLSVSIILDTAT